MSRPTYSRLLGAFGATVALLGITSAAHATFTINLTFGGGLSPSQQSAFTLAKATWESLITGYQPGISITGINITASGEAIDGLDGTLAQGGPTLGVNQGGFLLATVGIMRFDSADLPGLEATGNFNDVILHEMAHVFGFGTLWEQNGVYTADGFGRFTGVNALAAYREEYDALAGFVPVDTVNGPGTADAHWAELGIQDPLGRPLSNELMTGFLNEPTYISETTVQSFADIGYTVRSLSVVPEPGTFALLGVGLMGMVGVGAVRRRK